jgi:SAM-dependent methyltransferase
MSAQACHICRGPLDLLYPGGDIPPTPESMAPTNHHPGQHGDLYACRDCGTVHQPGLPRGEELAELYRGMSDDAYLSEEAGRRETAGRLLDLIQRHVPAGSLLDVGCGHGLLLDEARRRGFTVTGVELSQSAAAYARDVLELDVREQRVEDLQGPEGGYQVVVLADVVEHLDDPLAALDACTGLLAPGGALCVVTPDPGSRTARLAGPRWWAYIPAHTFLFPRATMRELLEAPGCGGR